MPSTRRRGRSRWRLAVDVALIVTLPGLAVLGFARDRGRPAAAETAVRVSGTDNVRYYHDVQSVLRPFALQAREIPETLAALADRPHGAVSDISGLTSGWRQTLQVADAELEVVRPPAGSEVGTLLDRGIELYQAAVATAARAAGQQGLDRSNTAVTGLRLAMLGDRLFDAGRRLMNLEGTLFPEVMVYPAEVPDFAAEGLEPGTASPRQPGGSGHAADVVATVPPAEWTARHEDALAEATDLLAARAGAGSGWAQRSTALAGPVPSVPGGREAVAVLRLALLVAAERDRAPGEAGAGLAAVAGDLWATARRLLSQQGVGLR